MDYVIRGYGSLVSVAQKTSASLPTPSLRSGVVTGRTPRRRWGGAGVASAAADLRNPSPELLEPPREVLLGDRRGRSEFARHRHPEL